MAKSKLEKALIAPRKNWELIKSLMPKYNLSPYFLRHDNLTFRQLAVKINLSSLVYKKEKIFNILKKSVYKENIEKYLFDGRHNLHFYREEYIKLINHHDIEVSPVIYCELTYNSEGAIKTKIDKDKMKEYILENTMDRVSDKTLKFVKNDLTIEQMLEIITHTRNINLKNKKELLSKIKFSRYFNYCVRENLDILTAYLSCFDKKVVLETLLKTKKKFHIRDEEQKEKIDISIEDTKNLLEKTSYKSIYRIFNIPFSEDYIGDILEVWNDPEHYSQQINDIVIRGEYKKLGKFTNFHRIELAPEAAKILYKRRKIGFASVKKHLSKEELKNVVDRKKEIFKYIYKRLNRAMNPVEEEQGEKCTEKYDCTCSVCSRGRDYKNRYRRNIFNEHTYVNLIYRLIEKYEFDYKFIVETMGKLEDIQDPMFVASTLMENKFESRHGMAGRGAAMRSMMMSRMMGY